ncbi:MAG: 3-hydroxyacyl-ACP dehydratase FabZ [Bacteroidales bacterium]|nr:3-hydroxyacyl-ACP dehydratase FabZ [Bacteroidales bacterium]
MNQDIIKTFIPHRDHMLLVDEINVDDNKIAHATYHVNGNEFFLQGHFPGNPVVPGVILCEIMAQSSALLIGEQLKGKTPFYAGIDKVRFKKQVRPGDTVEVTAKITTQRGLAFFIEASAAVNHEICCEGNMSFILVKNEK